MKKIANLAWVAGAAVFLMSACNSGPQNAHEQAVDPALEEPTTGDDNMHIDYEVADHFLVKHTVKEVPSNPKIETKEEFDRIFYCTEEDKKAHEIDFSKNYVIAVLAPDPALRTTVQPISLRDSEPDEVVFSYRWVSGSAQPDTTRSSIALVVDKKYDGTVILNEMK
ncbi:hypothetical protein [Sphingobacterium corticibacter]|uniref:Lipoprotein n=1 Tax=Sphingobacterium corticibacter TaxID=2171749 RepID=A0A2T8HJE6_9SPHI|nr:hypothetical protein [Sphingobacterium corticibacter]PVH25576.1 hypothetical protein DC487_06440 [Sphingobacterium corticibacter]